ncbi:MAG: NAD(+)/NADH kinase [Myxococcota bacterium]
MKRRPRILVVFKKSAYQVYALEKREKKVRSLIRRHAASMEKLTQAHQAHNEALDAVANAAEAAGAEVRLVYRAHLRKTTNVDLVVTVGGDGTLLDASHRVDGVPLLGVNSNPASSVGFLTGATKDTFPLVLDQVLRGRLEPLTLLRLDVLLNERSLGTPVLNDVLICHSNPAATSRYALRNGHRSEEQKSSGIWVATPAGSTAAILSAGGQQDELTAQRFQYRVREPYAPPGVKLDLVHGFVTPPAELVVESYMRQGAVFLDGSHIRYAMGMGDEVIVKAHESPLHLYRPARA